MASEPLKVLNVKGGVVSDGLKKKMAYYAVCRTRDSLGRNPKIGEVGEYLQRAWGRFADFDIGTGSLLHSLEEDKKIGYCCDEIDGHLWMTVTTQPRSEKTERAYKHLDYAKTGVCMLKTLDNKGCLAFPVPNHVEDNVKAADFELSRGHYKNCIKICNRTIPDLNGMLSRNKKILQDALIIYPDSHQKNGNGNSKNGKDMDFPEISGTIFS
jgi:hypothetical protein